MPRDLKVPGRELTGIYFAMEYLTLQNKRCEGDAIPADRFISAEGKDVVIIGGGDTGADCLSTVHRQGARSVAAARAAAASVRDARGQQSVAALAEYLPRLVGARRGRRAALLHLDRPLQRRRQPGNVKKLHGAQVEDGRHERTDVTFNAGARQRVRAQRRPGAAGDGIRRARERNGLLDELGVKMTDRGTVARDGNWMTSVPGVFTAGDMQRGQSLIVWAIAEGRSCARGVDTYLMGSSELAAPVR